MLIQEEIINDFLSNKKFHDIRKGCNVISFQERADKGILELKKCLTHNVICSKTGWEDGWYMGTKSKELPSKYKRKCKGCQEIFFTNKNNQYYCNKCLKKYE